MKPVSQTLNTCYHENAEYKRGRCVKSFDLLFPSAVDPKLHSVHNTIVLPALNSVYKLHMLNDTVKKNCLVMCKAKQALHLISS